MNSTPEGITPPTPRLDKEEPDLWQEDDIPSDNDRGRAAGDVSPEVPARPRQDAPSA